MSFLSRTFPELSDLSEEDGRRVFEVIRRRSPKWLILPFAALAMFAAAFIRPHILVFLEHHLSDRSADFVSFFVCVAPVFMLFDWVQRHYWIRPEIRRIRGPEPNKALHHSSEN